MVKQETKIKKFKWLSLEGVISLFAIIFTILLFAVYLPFWIVFTTIMCTIDYIGKWLIKQETLSK